MNFQKINKRIIFYGSIFIIITLIIGNCVNLFNKEDENDNYLLGVAVIALSNSNSTSFTKQIGTSGEYTMGGGVSTDLIGNIYLTGSATGRLDGNHESGGFLIKYDSYGNKQWTKQMNGTIGYGVSVDSSKNVYVTGSTRIALDGNNLTGDVDVFTVKYDSNGNIQWIKQMGASGSSTYGYGISTDSNGNSYVTGYTEGSLDGNSSNGDKDIFLIKYDSNGNKQWTKQIGTSGTDEGFGVSTDSNGNIYVTGTYYSNLFLIKYNSSGNEQWTQQMGSFVVCRGISIDTSGNVYVTGFTAESLNGNTLIGKEDVFIVKFDSNGNIQWIKQMGVSGERTEGFGISNDSGGNVYITGFTFGGLDGNNLTGYVDIFTIKYDSSGNKQWTKLLGAYKSGSEGIGVSTDLSGNIYVTGSTTGGLDRNSLIGKSDAFLIKYSASGDKK